MFRRNHWLGACTASALWLTSTGVSAADPTQGVQRAVGSSESGYAVQPVAGTGGRAHATTSTPQKSGGLLGGLKNIFGGSSGSSAEMQHRGSVPDAPAGGQVPLQDWSDLAHSPNKTKPTTTARTAPAHSAIPQPPQSVPTARPGIQDELIVVPRSSASSSVPMPPSSNDGVSIARRQVPAAAPVVSQQPPTAFDTGSYESEPPRVARRPVPEKTFNAPTSTLPSLSAAAVPSGNAATQASETNTIGGRRSNRADVPSLADASGNRVSAPAASPAASAPQTPSTPPSLAATKPAAESGAPAPISRRPASAVATQDAGDAATEPALIAPNRTTVPAKAGEAVAAAPKTVEVPAKAPEAEVPVPSGDVAADSFSARELGKADPAADLYGPGQASETPAVATSPASPITPPASAAPAIPAVALSTSTIEIPSVRVTAQGPAEISINQPIEYEILVENRGSTPAPGLLIRATLPESTTLRGHHVTLGDVATETEDNSRRLLWQVTSVPAGGTEKMVVRLSAEQATPFDVRVEWTFLPQMNVASVRVQEPKLKLEIEGPEEVVFGQTQVYKVRVLNPGTGPAMGVIFTLSPNSATPSSQRLGDIPAGKEAQFEIELSAADRGELEIHGLVNAGTTLRSEAIKRIKVAAADLLATLDGPPLKYQNTEGSYRLSLSNQGRATCQQVQAQLRIPSGVQYLGGIDGAQVQGDMLRWTVSELAPGQSVQYDLRCNMSTTGSHQLAFEARGSAAGSAGVNITTQVEAVADLVLVVNDPPAPAPVGTEVMYEVTIRNRGSKAATDIRAIAQFSAQIEPTRAEGHQAKLIPGQVLFDPIPRIEAGQDVTLRIFAKAEVGGTHRFRTEVTSGDISLESAEATKFIAQSGERVTRSSSDPALR